MIEKLDIKDVDTLTSMFKDVFTKEKVLYDIENNPFTNYYVYRETEIVACINYQVMYERSELIDINVLGSYQGKKIATKLMEFMFNDLKNKNVESITLEVKKTNIKAINLYKKFGFIEVGIRKGYYQGIDGILMKKELI